ncbi:hypothetical protein SAMN02745687_02439 [Lachnospiraceae bacterium NK3A20]|nr:hypothetical protein SAMN02745687_02439 [Lachnospiraceae bacterium NK3A20]
MGKKKMGLVPRLIIAIILGILIGEFMPLYICGTFVDMTYSGKTFTILGILWKVFLVVIAMQLIYIFLQFTVAGSIAHKNPFQMITQSALSWTRFTRSLSTRKEQT